jgi:hypothetical protein
LSTVAPPIAGQIGMSYAQFFLWDLAGSFIWAEAFLLPGRFFGDVAQKSAPFFHWLGRFAFAIFVLMVLGVMAYRFLKTRKFLQQVRELRLEPGELKAMMDLAEEQGNKPPFIVDLRHPLDYLLESSPVLYASDLMRSDSTAKSFLATATSCSIALARAKRPVPSLRCNSTSLVSTVFARCVVASTAGRKRGIHWSTTPLKFPLRQQCCRLISHPHPSQSRRCRYCKSEQGLSSDPEVHGERRLDLCRLPI